ncbi:MAG: HAMP domain-containing histidine kinase [Leptospirales bacterium]|nr:HAMP domain-containing histidine kinase [Leptospirales bacterium]
MIGKGPAGLRSAARRAPLGAASAISAALFLLLAAQLGWWLIFFQRNQLEFQMLYQQLDTWMLRAANGEAINGDALPELRRRGPRFELNPLQQQRRQEEFDRKLTMMVSETGFVFLVFSFGALRVVLAVRRERRLQEERQVFLDTLTHELKTPLAAMLLNLQTIERRALPEEQRRELLQECQQQIWRLEEQLNNILLSRRIDRDPSLGSESLSLRSEIEDYCQQHRRLLEEGLAELQLEVAADLVVRMDREALRSILGNAIQNALRYAGPQATLAIVARRNRRHIELHFSDNGPGVPDAERERIFEAFHRLPDTDHPVQGAGLGLHLVRQLAEAAGGTAYAPAAAQGFTLALRLPAASDGAA